MSVIRDFDELVTPEHDVWRAQLEEVGTVATRDLWPGCAAMALCFNPDQMFDGLHGETFIRNEDLKWLTAYFLPAGNVKRAERREVRWMSLVQAKLRLGAVQVNSADAELRWDFRRCPFDKKEIGRKKSRRTLLAGEGDEDLTLNCEQHPDLFRLANRLTAVATSYGWQTRRCWSGGKVPEDRQLVYGREGQLHKRVMPTWGWLPTPWVSVPADIDITAVLALQHGPFTYSRTTRDRFVRDVADGLRIRSPISGHYRGSRELKGNDWADRETRQHRVVAEDGTEWAFRVHRTGTIHRTPGEPVRAGDELGFAIPPVTDAWKRLPFGDRWFRLGDLGLFGPRLEFEVVEWAARHVQQADDRLLVPWWLADIASTYDACVGGLGGSFFDLMAWQLPTRALDLYDESLGAVVAPPVTLPVWHRYHIGLGDVDFVLVDQGDPRVAFHVEDHRRHHDRRRHQRQAAKTAKKHRPRKRQPAHA